MKRQYRFPKYQPTNRQNDKDEKIVLNINSRQQGVKRPSMPNHHSNDSKRPRNEASNDYRGSKGSKFEQKQNPNKNDFTEINNYIWAYFQDHSQTFECYQRKQHLRDVLYSMLQEIFPNLGVYIVGSSANGFGSNKSDVDMCVMVSNEEVDQKRDALELLKLLAKALRRTAFIKDLIVINARVPIIKFRDVFNNIECDININNHNGIRNTHLIKCYSDMDWRARPFVLMVKHWAKSYDINDAARQTISSYSFVLMSIFYLQAICSPPVLPNLQKLFPYKFNIRTDVKRLSLNEQLDEWQSDNKENLGELFLGFLEYYSLFDFENKIISVRTGTLIDKRDNFYEKPDTNTSWKYLCIEEPFELTNTARSVYDYYEFQRCLRVFRKSFNILNTTRSIEKLMEHKDDD